MINVIITHNKPMVSREHGQTVMDDIHNNNGYCPYTVINGKTNLTIIRKGTFTGWEFAEYYRQVIIAHKDDCLFVRREINDNG